MTGRLFVISGGVPRPVDPESKNRRPTVDCSRCGRPVERMILLRDGNGGWKVSVRCHDKTETEQVPWRDLLAGDLVVGPAFVHDQVLVRRLPPSELA